MERCQKVLRSKQSKSGIFQESEMAKFFLAKWKDVKTIKTLGFSRNFYEIEKLSKKSTAIFFREIKAT